METGKKTEEKNLSRRDFLTAASTTAATVGLSGLAMSNDKPKVSSENKKEAPVQIEWRNKVEGMAYRQLGRTGMMISEVVNGGDPVRLNNYRQVEIALERGVNYLDMAPAYGNGECEKAYSKVINSSSKRMKVFMTTKVSGFGNERDLLYQDVFQGLPSEKQQKTLKKAAAIREERMVDKPGYFLTYWPGQQASMDNCFISNAMVEDYGHKVDGSKQFIEKIKKSIDGSLKRAKTDHFDVLMCPHGANSAEEVLIPEIYATFESIRKEGKARFLGVSTHNDPAGVLNAVVESGQFDVVMCAYNIINGGYMDAPIRRAYLNGLGIIAMKVAMAVATHHKAIQPIPNWRIEKVNRIVPGDMKPPMKAYLWALQNPNISAVISNLWNLDFINENLSLVGKKVALNPG